jgi:hypothetical protein
MQSRRRDLDPCIYLLIEHLDAALAAGEQLTTLTMDVTEPSADVGPRRLRSREARFIGFVSRVRSLEASLIAHILQARRRAGELPRARGALKLLLEAFSGGTAALIDAVAEYGDPARFAFNTGADRLSYLRARGLMPASVTALTSVVTVEIDESFLVAGRLELGPLLDMIEAFLRALNVEYDLWRERSDDLIELDDRAPPSLSPTAPALADQIASVRSGLALSDQIANVRAALGTSDVTEVDPATGVRSSLLAALSQLESRR